MVRTTVIYTKMNDIATMYLYKLYFTEKEYINSVSNIFEGIALSVWNRMHIFYIANILAKHLRVI